MPNNLLDFRSSDFGTCCTASQARLHNSIQNSVLGSLTTLQQDHSPFNLSTEQRSPAAFSVSVVALALYLPVRVFSPLTPLAREMQMFHRRATGAQAGDVFFKKKIRRLFCRVFTMERLREITTERLRMMQEGGAFAMSGFGAGGGAPPVGPPAPWPGPARGFGLSPEELLTVRSVWRVSRESELCSDFDCCAICLDGSDDKRELIALPCEHVFCADCLCTWLARNPTCVLCKKDMRLAVAKLRRWHRTSAEDSAQT
ncbi:Rnf150 [Symbiodinium sp. CCMP2592]|nr:Rnf150 [Symbiodinium sp. CCMP2592]